MTRKTIYPIVLALLLLAGCAQKNDNTSENPVAAIPIKTQQVQTFTTNDEISLSGNIDGNTTVRLGFMVAGKINYISKNEGENISKGQVVASLDPTSYAIAKEMADVQVNATTDECNRLKIMHDRNSISDGDFSKITFALQQATVQQKLHEKNLSDTKLYAPISGVLLKKFSETGEIVGVGTPLFVISDITSVKVIAYIPEGELHSIRLGQSATVFISSLNATYTGKVIEVGSAADATSRAFAVKIALQNPKLLIRPGMIAVVRLSSTIKKEIMLLPAEAILRDSDKQSYVYVVDATQNKAFKRKISIGNVIDNKVAITSGLTNGETVVTAGQTKLNDAALISIIK